MKSLNRYRFSASRVAGYAACLFSASILGLPHSAAYAAGFAAPPMPAAPGMSAVSTAPLPFDDPAWRALIGVALLINAVLYILIWRRRTN